LGVRAAASNGPSSTISIYTDALVERLWHRVPRLIVGDPVVDGSDGSSGCPSRIDSYQSGSADGTRALPSIRAPPEFVGVRSLVGVRPGRQPSESRRSPPVLLSLRLSSKLDPPSEKGGEGYRFSGESIPAPIRA